MNKLLLLVLILTLPACGFLQRQPVVRTPEPVKVITETVQLEIYQPPLPPEIRLDDVQWFVLTEDNLEDKVADVKRFTGADFVVFGMTPQSYENMAYNLQEIRRYIRQQTEIIKYYREATQPRGTQGWLEQNETRQTNQIQSSTANTATTTEPEAPEPAGGIFSRLLPRLGN
jgi:hypothetical protein